MSDFLARIARIDQSAFVLIVMAFLVVWVAVQSRRNSAAQAALADQVTKMARAELDTYRERIEDLEHGRREDRRRISVLEEQLVAYWRGTQILIAQVVRFGQRPEWEPPALGIGDVLRVSPAAADGRIDGLYECLRTRFSVVELEVLAHDAGLDWEQSGAAGLPQPVAALRLYEYAERMHRLEALADAARKARPGAGV